MAVLSGVPGLVAWINVNGEPLTEHRDPDRFSSAKETSKYVESTPETFFTVCFLFLEDFRPNGQETFKVNVTIDGSFVAARLLLDRQLLVRPYLLELKYRQGWKFGDEHHSELYFSNISTTESNPNSDVRSITRYQNVGLIKLEVFRVKDPRPINFIQRFHITCSSNIRDAIPIPEKVLEGKFISQSVEYRTVELPEDYRPREYTLVNPNEGSIATFKFRYRSEYDLRMLGIIPFGSLSDYLKLEQGCSSDEEIRDLKHRIKTGVVQRANRRRLGVWAEQRDEEGEEHVWLNLEDEICMSERPF